MPARSDVATDVPVFQPPFLGQRVAKGISLDEIASYLNETALFRNQWQFRPEKARRSETDDEFKDRIRADPARPARPGEGRGLAGPGGGVGLLPGELRRRRPRRLDRRRPHAPSACGSTSRASRRTGSSASPTSSARSSRGDADYAGFHVVTIGDEASERERELFAADQYQEYLLLHGLSVEMTEALAELWHRRIREEWGFADEDGPTLAGLFRQQYRGSRYSWGYPACPDLEDQAKVAELLEIERIGVTLTEEFHLVPEQSTSAIIVPHPEAKYFIA